MSDHTSAVTNDVFLRACRGEPVDRIPVWFMRQAGRSLPGYRELRKKYDVLTLARTPELAAQVCVEPVGLLGVDAAILFADIMLLPIAMGVDVEIVDAIGPVIDRPVKDEADIARLKSFDPKNVAYLAETIRLVRQKVKVPLIGFSGAPFTLASYLIEGRPSRDWIKTKRFIFENRTAWNALMEKLSDAIVGYLSAQIDAGAQAVQLFDSWVGCLSPEEYRNFVLPHVQKIFGALRKKNVPRIHFGTDTAGMLKDFSNVDCEVIGVDWRIDIVEAKKMIGAKAIQGNLDPVTLLADKKTLEHATDKIISSLGADAKRGFIFNLGHGVPPEADDRNIRHLVDYIHGK